MVAEADGEVSASVHDVGEDRVERVHVAVDVGDDRDPHVRHPNRLNASRTLARRSA